jgi:hypothetical protein
MVSVDGISDMVECGRGLLFVVCVYIYIYIYIYVFFLCNRVWLGGTL